MDRFFGDKEKERIDAGPSGSKEGCKLCGKSDHRLLHDNHQAEGDLPPPYGAGQQAGQGAAQGAAIPPAEAEPPDSQAGAGGEVLRSAMRNDPMGRLILELTYKINELYADRQGNVPDVDRQPIDVQDIASSYFDVAMGQRRLQRNMDNIQQHVENINLDTATINRTNNQLADRMGDMERWRDERALNAVYDHPLYNSRVTAPKYYANQTKLNTAADLTNAYKLFPRGSGRFSGEKSSNYQVHEFLETINEIQDYLKLTEEEFKSRLIGSCTGKAHEFLTQWRQQGYTVPQMYHGLYLNFDRQDNADTAQEKLDQFKAFRNKSSAEVESAIAQLGMRACGRIPIGEARNIVYDYMCASSYFRALPDTVATFVRGHYNDLAAELRRQPTFSELSQYLDRHRYTLDLEIKKHGANPKHKDSKEGNKVVNYVGKEGKKPFPANKKPDDKKPRPKPARSDTESDKASGGSDRKDSGYKKTHKEDKGKDFKKKPKDKGKTSRSESLDSSKRRGFKFKQCSLCGELGHLASEGCYKMKDDQGNVVLVSPTYGACTLCPDNLHHPERYCPRRNKS